MNVGSNKTSKEKNAAKFVLGVISDIAVKNADMACRGIMYEPPIPKKLRH